MTAAPGTTDGRDNPDLGVLLKERRQLINLTYRLLGTVDEAEDAVQETYARWYGMSPEHQAAIESPGAWLSKVASRICLDQLGSARVRRERYVGEWLPEPIPQRDQWVSGMSGATADPADWVILDESISMAFLVVLDSLTPAERVAFVLHDVFGYRFSEIAERVGRTQAACRQLAYAARLRVRRSKTPEAPTATQVDVVRSFKAAWEAKDIAALIAVLDPDAIVTSDGGGQVAAALEPIRGAEHVARGCVEIAARAPSMTILERTVNGQPGLVIQEAGTTVTVIAFGIDGGRIKSIWSIRNPRKLRLWAR